MPISNRFAVLLAERGAGEKRRISIAEVGRVTGVAPRTLQAWANNTITRYDAEVIEALCNYFNCQPGDLIVKQ